MKKLRELKNWAKLTQTRPESLPMSLVAQRGKNKNRPKFYRPCAPRVTQRSPPINPSSFSLLLFSPLPKEPEPPSSLLFFFIPSLQKHGPLFTPHTSRSHSLSLTMPFHLPQRCGLSLSSFNVAITHLPLRPSKCPQWTTTGQGLEYKSSSGANRWGWRFLVCISRFNLGF